MARYLLGGEFMKIEDSIALVTGGARGLGRAIILRFIQEGAKVAFCDIRSKEGNKVVAEARKCGGDCIFIKTDITKRDQVVTMAKMVEEKYGRIDILVNNAGWSREQLFVDTNESDWEKVIALNFWGHLRVTRAVLDGMIARSSGSIVNISSDAGRGGHAMGVVYSGCKGGIISITKSLAQELVQYNIRVNCVSPGLVSTPLTMEGLKLNPEIVKKIEENIPMKRMGGAEEIAAAVLFLASDEASFITGQTLSVNGGKQMI
jgi:2-hydroxycyclohexanecarboxyl-CoA dehydrogenase